MLSKILVPLDGSDLAEKILGLVRSLIAPGQATEVHLLRALPEHGLAELSPAGTSPIAIVKKSLARLANGLEAAGVKTTSHVAVGDPAEVIVSTARTVNPSLIALSTHGRSGLSRLVRGSVAERVLRTAEHPVLVANPSSLGDAMKGAFKRILVPLDGSDRSATILPLAKAFAQRFGSEVFLFHVVDEVVAIEPMIAVASSQTPEQARAKLEAYRPKLEGVPVRVLTGRGSPGPAILEAIDLEKIDLVVIATHGRSGVSRWAFGSTAENVVRHGTVPLLVVRTPDKV